MFVAHLSAGYLLSRQYLHSKTRRLCHNKQLLRYILFGCFCSILPDLDLLYFYTIDNRQHPHHSYWTHMPVFWLLVSLALYAGGKWLFRKNLGLISVLLLFNTWLHLLLDTVAGGIYWLYPWNNSNVRFLDISARFDWWVLNYVFHWTFLIEITIVLASVYVLYQDRNRILAVSNKY